jgi:ABC-type transport system substrate-binding protein
VLPATYSVTLLSGQFDMAGFSWNGADASALIGLYGTGGANNFGKYSNSAVDKLFSDASTTNDAKQRIDDFARAQKILVVDDAVAYLTGQPPDLVTSTGNVHGLDSYAADGLWRWDQIWLSPAPSHP